MACSLIKFYAIHFLYRISLDTFTLLTFAIALATLAPSMTSAQRSNHRLLYGRTSWLPNQPDDALEGNDDTSRAIQGAFTLCFFSLIGDFPTRSRYTTFNCLVS